MNDQLPFLSQDFTNAWNEWIQYRKECKYKKYVPTGLKKTLSRLINDSGNNEEQAIKMINNAMAMSWRGIYPINESNGTNNGNITAIKSSNGKSAGAHELAGMLAKSIESGY